MNTQIIGYQISYLVFAIFVSCLIVFTIHKGFQRQDIITIPIFAILLFLIIDFSAKSMYQNKMEKFFTEGFESRLQERFTKEDLSEEEMNNLAIEDEILLKVPLAEEEMSRQYPPMEEEMSRKYPPMEEEMSRQYPQMEEEMSRKYPPMEEEMSRKYSPMEEEEESYQKYAPVGEKPTEKPSTSKPSSTPNGDKKAKEATDKQEERPDINKHLLDDGNKGLSNRNSETINPININVSYNNNRPFTVNDFDKNTPNGSGGSGSGSGSGQKMTDINSYRFDDGCMNRSVNSGIDNINQKYFPAYLENPLNKNQPKVDNNYEVRMMKRILNEQNDPSPVLLENPWSEWKPIDK
jgi:hypothetical protein